MGKRIFSVKKRDFLQRLAAFRVKKAAFFNKKTAY